MTTQTSTYGERLTDGRMGWQATLLGHALTTVALLFFSPTSLTADLMSDAGTPGDIVMFIFSIALVASIVDLIVNDVMPDRFVLKALCRLRPYAMLVLGMAYIFLATASSMDPGMARGGPIIIVNYTLTGGGCIWWAVAHAYQRMRDASAE